MTSTRVDNLQTFLLVVALASFYATVGAKASENACPEGYRLHYQAFCVNVADELSDILNGGVRGTTPYRSVPEGSQKSPQERVGYKFSNMLDGEHCKTAYVLLSKPGTLGPVAMALGAESCGFAGVGYKTLSDAEAEATKKCNAATIRCRLILAKEKD